MIVPAATFIARLIGPIFAAVDLGIFAQAMGAIARVVGAGTKPDYSASRREP
jgi:hypothetical protein